MFSNFIHLIVALLILSLYEPIDTAPFSLLVTLFIFVALSMAFSAYTWLQFSRLQQRVQLDSPSRLDHRFSQLVSRHTILALLLFGVDIWGLHLPTHLETFQWLARVPTVKALLFLMLFVAYLSLIWICAFNAHRMIYSTNVSRKTYVYSNFAFTIPILIPWTLVFGITDIIRLLPLAYPKRILDTPSGQITYFVLFLLSAAIFAPVLMQRFWRCRPMDNGPMRTRIETLCHRARVRYANIVHWPIFGGRMITAGVMGLVSRFRYIMVTDALLQLLTPDQVDQVIVHEIGHIKHRHLQIYLLFFIGVMLISYALLPLGFYLIFFFEPTLNLVLTLGFDINTFANIFSSILLVLGIVIYFRFLFGYFMRNFERQADTYVFQFFPTAQPLIDTFFKIIATSGQPADKPNWHHFSIQQRVDFLRACEHTPDLIHQHNRKVKKSLITVIVAFMLLGAGAFHLNQMVFGDEPRNINVVDIEDYLEKKQNKTIHDGMLYWVVGNHHYGRQNFRRAAASYEAAIELQPDNPDALNNLAWLLASDDLHELRDTQRAMQLAQRAIALKQAPHIWDTLAQAYFVNGHLIDAIAAEEKALSMNPEDPQIYKTQLEKFKQALGEKPANGPKR